MPTINDEKKDEKSAQPIKHKNSLVIDVITGMGTGSVCAGAFNPWDRALYLSVSQNKPFLQVAKGMVKEAIEKRSLRHPLFQGCGQAIVQRSFSWGSYYILQNQGKAYLYPWLRNQGFSEAQSQFGVGTFAGSVSGAITNPLSAIKSYLWKNAGNTFSSSVINMWKKGKLKPFLKGTTATVTRDTIFGSTYEVLRSIASTQLKKHELLDANTKFIGNLTAASFATIASAPLNYVRTLQYDAPPEQKPPTAFTALRELMNEVKEKKTVAAKAMHIQQRFRLGWGTLRVGAGMAVGQKIFDYSNELANSTLKPK